jgi:hypothetical protein
MFRRPWAVLIATLLLVLAGAMPAAAGPHGTDRPFRAAASGQFTFDFSNPRQCPAPFTGVAEAVGRATHLGVVQVIGTHCEGDGVSYDGRMTLTAANGDTITGTYVTHWVITPPTVHVTGWLSIDGGTGRFSGATGRVWQDHVITMTSGVPPWPLAMTFTGRIAF